MDAARGALFVFLMIVLILTPDTQRSTPHQQLEIRNILDNERHAIDILNTTKYGDFEPAQDRWLNVTGLRQEDGYAWDLLPKVQARAREQTDVVVSDWMKFEKNGPELKDLGARYKSSDFIDGEIGKEANASAIKTSQLVPFYQNISGIVNGKWIRSKIADNHRPIALNLTALNPRVQYTTKEYNRNISGVEGNLRIKFDEKRSQKLLVDKSSVREIKAVVTVQDETSSGDGWEMTMYGTHYPESGGVLLSTSSDKFAGIFALPHFARSEPAFILAQHLLNQTLMAAVTRQEEASRYTVPSFPWSSSPDNPSEMMFPTPHCEFIMYLQQHIPAVGGTTSQEAYQRLAELQSLEEELRYPTGAGLGNISPLVMSAVVFSPDCGFVLESKGPPEYAQQLGEHLSGPKLESYLQNAKRIIMLFCMILAGQIYLLMRQMRDTSTPSTRSRVSFYTIALMAMGDGFTSIGFWTVSMVIDATFLVMISTAFLAFLCVCVFGMKFLMDIWTVQGPERREAEQRNAAANLPAPPAVVTPVIPVVIVTTAGADTLPLPVTARRPADEIPIILPPDQDLTAAEAEDAATITTTGQVAAPTTLGRARNEMGALYTRFYFLLMGTLFLSLHATGWRSTIRSLYANLLSLIYLSLWTPQIYRNIMRNCRKALRWEFVIGQSILRLIPFIYFYAVTDNILFITTDRYAAYVLVGWVWLQVWALVSQEILGPRFLVPNGWAPPAYDYHPVLREDDEEAGATMPIGFTEATTDNESSSPSGESEKKGHRTFDCAICMQSIDVPVVSAGSVDGDTGSSLATSLFSRRAYMVTPCRHIFHSPCLEGWMRYRLQCPICRENLPPL
ncbi:hypothetical protein MMC34_000185 [Xylographa carneopallida]|nr:hypothetical protein [Xylographa carneopallida]